MMSEYSLRLGGVVWDRVEHRIDDGYVDHNKESVDNYIAELSKMALEFYDVASPVELIAKKRKSSIDYDNPATKRMCDDIARFDEWLAIMPTALALEPLTSPDDRPEGNSPWSDEWLPITHNCCDAIGLRSRIAMANSIMQREVDRAVEDHERAAILSLACGAAKQVIGLADKNCRSGTTVDLSLVDIDPRPLDMARREAKAVHLPVSIYRRNIVDLDGFQHFHWGSRDAVLGALSDLAHHHVPNITTLRQQSMDVVDILGFFEYLLNVERWHFSYANVFGRRKHSLQAGAPLFLSMAWRMVAPGGILLFGNMNRSDGDRQPRPQLGFTLGVIQWPHIQPRDCDEVTDIVKSAIALGLVDVDSISQAEMHTSPDGIYNVYVLRKAD